MAENINIDAANQNTSVSEVMEVDSASEDFSFENQAFAQDLLREKIINYAIRTANGKPCGKYIAVLRSLGKNWMLSVSKVLRQNNEPLFKIFLNKENSLNGTQIVSSQGKLLDRFVNSYKQTLDFPYPTYRLNIAEEFFQLENYDSLNNCLLHCAQGLVELSLKVPQNGGSLPCIFSNITLPNLEKMRVQFRDTVLTIPANSEFVGHSGNLTQLLQSLLNKNGSLKELVFPFYNSRSPVPSGFQYISLPASLTKLELSCVLVNHEPEILARSWLPNLSTLILMLPHALYPEGLINRILENFCKTLLTLEFVGLAYNGPPSITNFVRFPVMEKLVTFRSKTVNWEHEFDISSVDAYFPKLERLELFTETRTSFRKWTTHPASTQVKTLYLSLVNVNQPRLRHGFYLPIKMERMHRLHLTFSNLQSLTLKLTGDRTCGLKYLFMEMQQLTYLCLIVADADRIANSDLWDSILIGIPTEIVAGMRANPDFLKHMEIKYQELPSIQMMTGLSKLGLHSEKQSMLPNNAASLISDFTFEFALLNMPGLRSISTSGRFKASEKMTNAWNTDKRKITYSTEY